MKLIVLVIVLSACTYTDTGSLVTSVALQTCDVIQTTKDTRTGWKTRMENNPILGEAPSTSKLITYNAVTMAVELVVWKILPPGYRTVLGVSWSGVSAYALISSNRKYICY